MPHSSRIARYENHMLSSCRESRNELVMYKVQLEGNQWINSQAGSRFGSRINSPFFPRHCRREQPYYHGGLLVRLFPFVAPPQLMKVDP